MKRLIFAQAWISAVLLAVFLVSFFLLKGGIATGEARMALGIISLVPVIAVVYFLNSFTGARLISLMTAFSAILFGVLAPVGYCATAIAFAALLVIVLWNSADIKNYAIGEGQSLLLIAVSLLVQYATISIFVMWLVNQIF